MIGRTGTDALELPRNKLLVHDVLSIPLASDSSLKFKKAFNTYSVIILENRVPQDFMATKFGRIFQCKIAFRWGKKTALASGKIIMNLQQEKGSLFGVLLVVLQNHL